jgi:hypothetical protein
MNRTIWMYWEGAGRPAYLDLCYETVVGHSPSFEVKVLDERSVFDVLPDLRRDIFRAREIANRVDYIRARVVYEQGGVWLDSDVVLMRPVRVEEALEKHDFVGYGEERGKPSIGFFAANKGAPVLGEWIEGMDGVLDRKGRSPLYRIRGYRLGWSELGYDILWKLFEGRDYHHLDVRRFAPIRWDDWKEFFRTDLEPEEIVDDETVAVMLYNKFMYEPLRDFSRDELLTSETLLGKLFRLSLGDEK